MLLMRHVPFVKGKPDMSNKAETTEAGREYAAAYAVHYTERDLPGALRLYVNVIASYPGEKEVEFSRAQVRNIVNVVVPKQELFDAQVNLAVAHFGHERLST